MANAMATCGGGALRLPIAIGSVRGLLQAERQGMHVCALDAVRVDVGDRGECLEYAAAPVGRDLDDPYARCMPVLA